MRPSLDWRSHVRREARDRVSAAGIASGNHGSAAVGCKLCQETETAPLFMADIGAGRDPRLPPALPAREPTVALALGQYAASHLPDLRAQQSAKTAVNVLQTYFGTQPLTTLEHPAPIENFRRTFKDRKPATVNRYLARLRHFIGWAQARGWMNRTPFHRHGIVISTKREAQRGRRLHVDEEKALLDACSAIDTREHWYAGREMHLRIVAALDLGLRRGEMLAVRNRDVDWIKHRVVLRGETTKSARTRAVPFDPRGRLAKILEARRFLAPDAHVFGTADGKRVGNFRTAWETLVLLAHGEPADRATRKARVNTAALKRIDLRWHDLRHEAACRWREKGLDLREIQLLLGHSTLLVTQRYLNVTDDELTEAMTAKLGWGKA